MTYRVAGNEGIRRWDLGELDSISGKEGNFEGKGSNLAQTRPEQKVVVLVQGPSVWKEKKETGGAQFV
jgi:hypothetical protein